MTPAERQAYNRAWYAKNKEATIKRAAIWAKANRDKRIAIHARHYDKRKARELGKKTRMVQHLGGRCADCDGRFPDCAFDFHHLDPNQKDFALAKGRHYTWEKIERELSKCVLLCANCHRIRHGVSEISTGA